MRTAPREVVQRVIDVLGRLMEESGIEAKELRADTSLIDDLALDSLMFVDLTLALERSFDIPEFPMQEWVDREAKEDGARFTVRSLSDACVREGRTGHGHQAEGAP